MTTTSLDNITLATDRSMPMILGLIDAANEVGVDTETTGLNVRNGIDYMTGFCWSVEGHEGYIPFRHNKGENVGLRWRDPLMEVLKNKNLIWHNRKFDMHSLKTFGMDPLLFTGIQYDTMMIAQLVDEEMWSKELDFLAKRFLQDEKTDHIKELAAIYGWANIPPEILAPYGAHDAQLTRRLKSVLWPRLVSEGLSGVYLETEMPFTRLLYKMEQRGVGVNKSLASDMAQRGRTRMGSIQRELKFNPASTKDLGNYLLNELKLPVVAPTPKGKPSFNKLAMEEYDELLQASNNPAAKRIAEFRGWQKATTSLYEPLLTKIGPDGRVRTEFKQHGTVTGRLSASNPNLQQVPRATEKPWNGKAKACFTSGREDYLLYGWDYSQVELRLAAAYGEEALLLKEFEKEDADPFSVLTQNIFNISAELFDKEDKHHADLRHKTKNCLVYPSLYGAGLRKVISILDRPDAEQIYYKYKSTIPNITAIADRVNRVMETQKYVTYWDGRRRHIKRKDEAHKAWNSLLQGGAAQLMKKAMLRIEEHEDNDFQLVLTVHDEATAIIHKDAIPDYEPHVKKAMCDWPQFPVKFAIEGKEWK